MNKLAGLLKGPYIAQLFSLGGSAALTFFSALFLAPGDRGLVAVFLAVVSVGGYIACFGVQSEILQHAARDEGAISDTIIRRHVIFQILLALATGFVLIWFKPFQGMSDQLSYLAAGGIFVGSLFNNLSWRQYGGGKFFLSTALRGAVPLTTLAVAFGLYLFATVSAESVAGVYVVLQLACLPMLISWRGRRCEESHVSMRRVYGKAGTFFFCQTESLVLARTPVIASGLWLSPDLTAAISIALSLAELQSSLPQMRSAISFKEASSSGQVRLTFKQLQSAVLVLVPGTVIVVLLSFLARSWLNEAYSQLPLYVGLLTLGVAFQAVAASAINILTARRTLGWVIVILLVVVVLAVACLSLFKIGSIALALASWSVVVAAGCAVVIVLSMRRKKGRHL